MNSFQYAVSNRNNFVKHDALSSAWNCRLMIMKFHRFPCSSLNAEDIGGCDLSYFIETINLSGQICCSTCKWIRHLVQTWHFSGRCCKESEKMRVDVASSSNHGLSLVNWVTIGCWNLSKPKDTFECCGLLVSYVWREGCEDWKRCEKHSVDTGKMRHQNWSCGILLDVAMQNHKLLWLGSCGVRDILNEDMNLILFLHF